MTQKELLYYEDAINHEISVLKIIEDISMKLKDKELISFMESEYKIHKNLKKDLLNKLEENTNE